MRCIQSEGVLLARLESFRAFPADSPDYIVGFLSTEPYQNAMITEAAGLGRGNRHWSSAGAMSGGVRRSQRPVQGRIHRPNAVLMLVRRRRRRTSIKTALFWCLSASLKQEGLLIVTTRGYFLVDEALQSQKAVTAYF